MAVLLWILGSVAVAIGGLVLVASQKPDRFRVTRKAVVPATPEAVFAALDDLEIWQEWSPGAKKDPNAKGEYGPSRKGVGAWFSWDGNKDIGKGTMSIRHAEPHTRVEFDLVFEKPFKAENAAIFTLLPVEGGTEVEWALEGASTLMSKVMDVLINMDKMCGRDFEAGLANLAALMRAKAH